MPDQLVTIDPGVTYFGWALWDYDRSYGHLMSCGRHDMPTLDSAWPEWWRSGACAVLSEGQAHYKGLANAKAVLGLARMTGAVVSRAAMLHGEIVAPDKWKRQVSRNAIHGLILKQMTPWELDVYTRSVTGLTLSKKRDVTAAIGIGMWKFGRLQLRPGMATRSDP